MTTLAIINQKGGSAKTTTVVHLGAALAALGKRVLLVDMDPQGHLAETFNISARALDREMSTVLMRKTPLRDVIVTVRPNLDLAPSNIRLSYSEPDLLRSHRREDRLKTALATVQGDYDVVLIDCPPNLGLLTVNALSAARYVLIPMAADFYNMLGVGLFLETLDEMRAELNPDLQVLGLLPTRYDKRTANAAEILERTRRPGRRHPDLRHSDPRDRAFPRGRRERTDHLRVCAGLAGRRGLHPRRAGGRRSCLAVRRSTGARLSSVAPRTR